MKNFSELPKRATVGDVFSWPANFDGFPPDAYSFEAAFLSKDMKEQFSVGATEVDGSWLFILADDISTKVKWGQYYFQVKATDKGDGSRLQVGKGGIFFMPDFAAQQEISQNQKILDAIEARMQDRANDDIGTITINGKTLTSLPTKDLVTMHTYYSGLVQQAQNKLRMASGLGSRRDIRITFGPRDGGNVSLTHPNADA